MTYMDNPDLRRRRTRLERRPAPSDPRLDNATANYIRQVAAEYPRLTSAEVYAEIAFRGRGDITVAMVRAVLAEGT